MPELQSKETEQTIPLQYSPGKAEQLVHTPEMQLPEAQSISSTHLPELQYIPESPEHVIQVKFTHVFV